MIWQIVLGVVSFVIVGFMLYVLVNFHRESKRARQINTGLVKRLRNECRSELSLIRKIG
jgi:hypothetical protein